MKRLLTALLSFATAAALFGLAAQPAAAYGGGASHDMWQVGLSANCNKPAYCGDELGGFWGWAEFDRSADGTTTWGDAQFAGCGHVVGGGGPGFAGAGHVSIEIESWTIGAGSAGPQTFLASGEETDFFHNTRTTFDFTNQDTGVPATPGHYHTKDILGFSAPGVAFQIQVAFRPAR